MNIFSLTSLFFLRIKAYLEFFVSPETLEKLKHRITKFSSITYNAINKAGDLHTNTNGCKPNAVTWGVFPGREVVQPTIVELSSFEAWKDEAFALWEQWSRCHPQQSKPRELLSEMAEQWYLVNIVNNDYHEAEGIFELFREDAVAAQAAQEAVEKLDQITVHAASSPSSSAQISSVSLVEPVKA